MINLFFWRSYCPNCWAWIKGYMWVNIAGGNKLAICPNCDKIVGKNAQVVPRHGTSYSRRGDFTIDRDIGVNKVFSAPASPTWSDQFPGLKPAKE